MKVVGFKVLESHKKFQVIPLQNLIYTQLLAKGVAAGISEIQQNTLYCSSVLML